MATTEKRAVEDLETAFHTVVSAVEAIQDPQQRLEVATAVVTRLREMTWRVAELRAQAAATIHANEGLSLTQLADRVGVSKTRAEQLLKQAKKKEG